MEIHTEPQSSGIHSQTSHSNHYFGVDATIIILEWIQLQNEDIPNITPERVDFHSYRSAIKEKSFTCNMRTLHTFSYFCIAICFSLPSKYTIPLLLLRLLSSTDVKQNYIFNLDVPLTTKALIKYNKVLKCISMIMGTNRIHFVEFMLCSLSLHLRYCVILIFLHTICTYYMELTLMQVYNSVISCTIYI